MARTLKQQVRKVIKEYYGNSLSKYARMAGDGKLIDTFVSALAHAIKPYSVSSPSIDCTCKLTWFDGHPSPNDIEFGKRIRTLRIKSLISVKELATKMGVHPDYLDELEKGKLSPRSGTRDTVTRALGLPNAKDYLSQDLDEAAETEAWIRFTISEYFGRSLWSFHPEVSYEESIDPFVKALVDLDASGRQIMYPSPIEPSLGDMIRAEEKRRDTRCSVGDIRSGTGFIETVTAGIKDPQKAEMVAKIMQASFDGNSELADIMSRMIKTELDNLKAPSR
jgi:transcriptional regulator with XRE-family HTH domain